MIRTERQSMPPRPVMLDAVSLTVTAASPHELLLLTERY